MTQRPNKLLHRKTTRSRSHFSAEQGVMCLEGNNEFKGSHLSFLGRNEN